jgi:hypothetical protein
MLKIGTSLALSSALIATGCAQTAKNVDAAYVSPSAFSGRNCNSLTLERNEIVRNVNRLTEDQNKAATDDAVITGIALVLFWPAAIALAATKDKSSALSVAKGNYDTITSTMEKKGCRLPPPTVKS